MNSALIHSLYAAFAPWVALSLLLFGRNPHPTRKRIVGSILISLGILIIPIEYFSIARWIAVLEPNPSITLTALLAIALIARVGGPKLLRSQDWKAAWIFGSLVSLILYPMGLGLTTIDPYGWGWGITIPLGVAAAATFFLLWGNRFGIVLLLVLFGMLLHPMESANAWDYLMDPCYGIFSLLATIMILEPFQLFFRHSLRRHKALGGGASLVQ